MQQGQIAAEYEKKISWYRKSHTERKWGHGSGVNTGMKLARGLYFKVVDSDDWLDAEAYRNLLKEIKTRCGKNQEEMLPDLIVCNYVYNHLEEGTSRSMHIEMYFLRKKYAAGMT